MDIKEDYCSYEVAKLLKEKGFNERTSTYFYNGEEFNCTNYDTDWNSKGDKWVSRPTHQMAMKYLRGKGYSIEVYVCVDRYDDGLIWAWSVCEIIKADVELRKDRNYYHTYEGAVEAALKYCLTKLI